MRKVLILLVCLVFVVMSTAVAWAAQEGTIPKIEATSKKEAKPCPDRSDKLEKDILEKFGDPRVDPTVAQGTPPDEANLPSVTPADASEPAVESTDAPKGPVDTKPRGCGFLPPDKGGK